MKNLALKKLIRPAIMLLLLTTLVTGVFYPLLVTLVAQHVWPEQAAGSLLKRDAAADEQFVGSALIGQGFSGATYFWSRPSATTPMPYNAANSMGSNLGPTNPALLALVQARVHQLRAAQAPFQPQPDQVQPDQAIPTDLLSSSGSGLDPHISPAAAFYQVQRVAAARSLQAERVRALLERHIEAPQWGIFGDARVNVLRLNLALDRLSASVHPGQ
ncbi:MAG: potassium-transporting ATPase subunit KdpC [Pseudomonadota bacterium]